MVLSLLLSWGKNFSILTDFFIDYIPMYNKFRAVSSIQVILELCVPALAILGMYQFFKIDDKKQQFTVLWKSGAVVFGLLVLLFVLKGMFDFAGGNDGYFNEVYGPEFMRALREDRMAMYTSDVLRSMGFVVAVFAALYLVTSEKLKATNAVIIVGVLMVADLFFIDRNYVNKEDFVAKHEMEQPFQPTQADMQILQDKSTYRVFDTEGNMSSARASYFHHSIGGYHAAKPRRMQQLFDYQIANNNVRVMNMLNVKYIIRRDDEGKQIVLENPAANGNAWFVDTVRFVKNADEEMKALDKLDTNKEAIIKRLNSGNGEFSQSNSYSVVSLINPFGYKKDSLASIQLEVYKPNYLKYTSNNSNEGFAVFSEMYYKNGWTATIDGKASIIYNVNYVLRGLQVPAGKHTIEFKFEPEVIATGSKIALGSSILMLLLIGFGVYKIKE